MRRRLLLPLELELRHDVIVSVHSGVVVTTATATTVGLPIGLLRERHSSAIVDPMAFGC
jgi:hypothetical protein